MKEVVLDIDQTLAGGVVPAHIGYYNEKLGLGMTHDETQATIGFAKTFDVPEIIAYRSQGESAERRFQEIRTEIRTSADVHLSFQALPGSVEGVQTLLSLGTVSYYTVRPQEVRDATMEWLKIRGFPNPEAVVLCENPKDKLLRIITDKIESKSDQEIPTVLLIDDSFDQLVAAATEIVKENSDKRRLMEHIILVGFGMNKEGVQLEGEFYIESGLRTLQLPAWNKQHLDQFLTVCK